ncbi:hypothetical protein AbraIFM66951_000116 [Aspergillus brasiliensis]|uniref:Uncharacterized protein n=1 Tax=Aspergillus brasiliensis TaxID=319629 RepID=A0A9W5YEH6_9EURO|nr:hypothetical protein AbraCBS73388_000230 [Aspergillus brasiliensis]GKZ40354.1 hypothetical protein AbraIFM66951_000116 [Aspergillus brasiliensis]
MYDPPIAEEDCATETDRYEDALDIDRRQLRQHLGLGPEPGDPPSNTPQIQPLFFIEQAPNSRGAKCKLSICGNNIWPGELRLALNPSMAYWGRYRSSCDYYHIHCFEKIADFSQADFLDRIQPVTRHTWKLRGLKGSSVLDGNYFVSGGVERLVLEWKVTLGKWMDMRDGVYDEESNRLSEDFEALLRKAGSAEYPNLSQPEGMTYFEYHNLRYHFAPYESDGPGDTEEWNLFTTYLDSTAEALDKPHSLSTMLQRYQNDAVLARKDERELDEAAKEARRQLGEKAVRALRRLSTIPIPPVSLF